MEYFQAIYQILCSFWIKCDYNCMCFIILFQNMDEKIISLMI